VRDDGTTLEELIVRTQGEDKIVCIVTLHVMMQSRSTSFLHGRRLLVLSISMLLEESLCKHYEQIEYRPLYTSACLTEQ